MIPDPRPDLEQDSEMWQILLTASFLDKKNLYELLRELRAHGSRLYLNSQTRDLCFNFGVEMDEQKKQELKEKAKPYRYNIKNLFMRVYSGLEMAA